MKPVGARTDRKRSPGDLSALPFHRFREGIQLGQRFASTSCIRSNAVIIGCKILCFFGVFIENWMIL